MNKKHLLHLSIFVLSLIGVPGITAQAQVCSGDAPQGFSIVMNPANPSECYLQINWGDAMPLILCGSPGTPAAGSTIPDGRRIDFLYATIDGVEYTLYDRGECINGTNMLMYGPEPNTYITALAEVDFCLADAERFIQVEGIQLGADDFDCFLSNAQSAAPIELAYFRGNSKEDANLLEWATLSQENTSVFVVERSPDGKRNIETVGTLEAKGYSYDMEYYQLEDRSPRSLAYYRLRAIDFDGSQTTSDWVVIQRRSNSLGQLVQVAPVPLGKEPLHLQYEATTEENVIVTLTDINGRQLWQERKNLEAGIYNWALEFPDFKQHMLILKIHNREGVITRLIPCETGN